MPRIDIMEIDALTRGCTLVETWVAGTPYYDAGAVQASLELNQQLVLRREPHNPHDAQAVEILTRDTIKLGYVPRRCNAGIAKRLDAGIELTCHITQIEQDDDYVGIRFKIVSLAHGDAPDVAESDLRPEIPRDRRRDQVRFAQNDIHRARDALRQGNRHGAFAALDGVFNWAIDAWADRHPDKMKRRGGWVVNFSEFMRDWPDSLRQRVGRLSAVMMSLLDDELNDDDNTGDDSADPDSKEHHEARRRLRQWRAAYTGDPAARPFAQRVNQLDWSYLSEVCAVAAVLCGERADLFDGSPRADRLPANRRDQVLRCVFRWLRVMDDAERPTAVPVSRLKLVRALNRDTELIISLQIEALQRDLDLMPRTPEEEAREAQYRERWPLLFPPPLVPVAEKRQMLRDAIELMQRQPSPKLELLELAERLRRLQPETRRRKRRRYRLFHDTSLYLAECFLRNAARERMDLYETIRLLTVCVPYRRLNRFRFLDLARVADRLARRYFGVSHRYLRNAVPPPTLTVSKGVLGNTWIWRDNGPVIPSSITPYDLCESWQRFASWVTGSGPDWSDARTHEQFRQGLHLRTLVRDQLLLSSPRLARRLRDRIDGADFTFLAGTSPAKHAWGTEWEEAYGHLASTHWWYYRRPRLQTPPTGSLV